MKALERKILSDGSVINNDVLKIDNFLNFQIDVQTICEIAKFFAKEFKKIDRILTVEASGIAIGMALAIEYGNIPLVFAKKQNSTVTMNDGKYVALAHSFTHNNDNQIYVSKSFVHKGENVLIVDDFLAAGSASLALIDIVRQAEAHVVGVAVAVEKEFQGGRKKIEAKGIRVISAARITKFESNKPIFYKE